ncbi:cytochrome P450 [Panaeolus papilionaceus]|nr:cytochrome P450 [Panaeolus papilionaceus]
METLLNLLSDPYYAAGAIIAGCTFINLTFRSRQKSHRIPLPPGPKGFPLIGSLLEVPRLEGEPWKTYDQWRRKYGDMIYYEVLGQPFLILGTLETAQELFEKRSTNYSSRPPMHMARDLVGWDFSFTFFPYGQQWRKDRRVFHEHFHSGAVKNYQAAQLKETHIFLQLLLDKPGDFLYHVRHTFAATIMRACYGITVEPTTNSVYVTVAEKALNTLSLVAIPGSFLVDIIPALKYVPQWFPGAEFKRKAARWRKELNKFINLPFNHVKELMRAGTAVPCLLTKLLDALPDEGDPSRTEEENRAKHVPANAFAAGSDTTVSTVQTFFLAMAIHPEVAKKAQVELDAVVGSGRLPDFSDRPSLPYIDAIAKECMRWKLVTNLGLAHMVSEDDEYRGYFIPKGTIVMGNSWAILHDPEIFDDPEEFIPERFLKDGKLDPSVRDPSTAAFGFGRRICPGRHFSDQNLFIIIASTLAAFDIQAPLDDNGKPITLVPQHTSGFLAHPLPFECRITPRSTAVHKLIRNSLDMV